jgi:NAD(P)-dependent dehydrogenase (short-subunit alcohol dehydrogenase family)
MHKPANVAVIGSSGGIGAALVRELADDEAVATIHALSRTGQDASPRKATPQYIDICDEDSVRRAADVVGESGPLDIVIAATGILHQGAEIAPEKAMRELSPDALAAVFAANCIGPALVAKYFLPLMRNGEKSVFAALSARVGSIEDNRLGGWVSYRASKAALNMVLKTLSIEHARRWPESVVVGLHPGTVDTALSRPFSKRVEPDKLFTPERAARHLLAVVDGLNAADSGYTYAWDGKRIPF